MQQKEQHEMGTGVAHGDLRWRGQNHQDTVLVYALLQSRAMEGMKTFFFQDSTSSSLGLKGQVYSCAVGP